MAWYVFKPLHKKIKWNLSKCKASKQGFNKQKSSLINITKRKFEKGNSPLFDSSSHMSRISYQHQLTNRVYHKLKKSTHSNSRCNFSQDQQISRTITQTTNYNRDFPAHVFPSRVLITEVRWSFTHPRSWIKFNVIRGIQQLRFH